MTTNNFGAYCHTRAVEIGDRRAFDFGHLNAVLRKVRHVDEEGVVDREGARVNAPAALILDVILGSGRSGNNERGCWD